MDVRAFASLYSSLLSPGELTHVSAIEGPARDLAALGAAFAGPASWMPEMF
jgi:hypothetical protein